MVLGGDILNNYKKEEKNLTVYTKKLVDTETPEYVVELVLKSGYIKNADPLSLIISAPVGSGKTEIINQYRNCKGVLYLSEATAYGIESQYLEDIKSGKIRHIIIGDLLAPLSKQKKTRDCFIAFFNTLMEEGISSIHTYAKHWDSKTSVKCGLITTIAEPDMIRSARRWFEMGFLSRAIPLTYRYSTPTEVKIFEHIAGSKELHTTPEKEGFWLPKIPVRIKQDKQLNLKLIELAMETKSWEKAYGFRRQEQLQTLLMANALHRGSLQVEQQDFDKILELSKYINLNYKEL